MPLSSSSAVRLLAVLLLLLGPAECAFHRAFMRRAPSLDDYRALAPRLLGAKKPGQPVVVAPYWAEPLVRHAAGDAAFPLSELGRTSDDGFDSFLEVSLLGESAPELSSFTVRRVQRAGPFELRERYRSSAKPSRFDGVTAVEGRALAAQVKLRGAELDCHPRLVKHTEGGGLHGHAAHARERYVCPGGGLVSASLIEDQAYRPRRCILTRIPPASRIELRFESIPGGTLVAHAGMSFFLSRDGVEPGPKLDFSSGARRLAQHEYDARRGFQRYELGSIEPAALVVGIDNPRAVASELCVQLEVR
jgi:hypothetical protein